MTREEAIEILRDTPIDIRSTREDDIHTLYATAQNMAIEALNDMAERKDEPQTKLVNDSPILAKDLVDDEFNPYDEECMRCKHLKLQCEFVPSYCKYEPKDEPQTNADQHVQHVGSVDLISRQDALEQLCEDCRFISAQDCEYKDVCKTRNFIMLLPSADKKQVTGKLNNRDDSLLTADAEAVKERKSKLDLISRQVAIDVVGRFRNIDGISVWHNGIKESIRIAIIEDLAKLPSADRPTGEWQDKHGKPMRWTSFAGYCSNCGKWSEYLTDYCGNCGAKMGGDTE